MATLTLSVVAPDKSVVETEASSVVAPGTEGYFGIQAGHVPLVAALKPGIIEYMKDNQRHYVYIGGGFAQVSPTGVTILADEAESAKNIDLSKAEELLDKARKALTGTGEMSSEQATEELERAIQRMRAARTAI
jgi:F-type H+-transporting ATPase subunit epsilon